MLKEKELLNKFKPVFEIQQAAVLAEAITEAYTDLVNTSDFNELKAIVKDLAEAQKRTEHHVEELTLAQERTELHIEELAGAQKELAEAQKRTESRVEELAEAQKDLAEAQKGTEVSVKKLAQGLDETRREVGGLSRSMGYALENEAYRALPQFLKTQYGIELTERLVRKEIGGEEINFFAKAKQDDTIVLIVGESKLRLDERRYSRQAKQKIFDTLERKIAAVRTTYPKDRIIPLLVTHYARPAFVQKAQEQGVILVQSFEW